eukprot:TRINITY_DN24066_c0_g1_i1.p1 TRINITY_DN24066_c0_g1~~TRINITY_DN24066_c0_g1_i1.p1  ORF type:complete len:153 (+),score=13.06 TRINITY_DN24066_c0_g1_i1:82-540(+)
MIRSWSTEEHSDCINAQRVCECKTPCGQSFVLSFLLQLFCTPCFYYEYIVATAHERSFVGPCGIDCEAHLCGDEHALEQAMYPVDCCQYIIMLICALPLFVCAIIGDMVQLICCVLTCNMCCLPCLADFSCGLCPRIEHYAPKSVINDMSDY